MTIHTINVDDPLFIEKIKDYQQNILFIDWMDTSKKDTSKKDNIHNQLDSLNRSIKLKYDGVVDINIIIFDRNLSMTSDEIDYLKNKVILWEPAINNRKEFSFMPYWYDFSEPSLDAFIHNNSKDIVKIYPKDNKMPDISCINDGVIPMVDMDNWLWCGLFDGLLVRDYKDVQYISDMYPTCGWGYAKALLNRMEKYLPNMKIDNFIDCIVSVK